MRLILFCIFFAWPAYAGSLSIIAGDSLHSQGKKTQGQMKVMAKVKKHITARWISIAELRPNERTLWSESNKQGVWHSLALSGPGTDDKTWSVSIDRLFPGQGPRYTLYPF